MRGTTTAVIAVAALVTLIALIWIMFYFRKRLMNCFNRKNLKPNRRLYRSKKSSFVFPIFSQRRLKKDTLVRGSNPRKQRKKPRSHSDSSTRIVAPYHPQLDIRLLLDQSDGSETSDGSKPLILPSKMRGSRVLKGKTLKRYSLASKDFSTSSVTPSKMLPCSHHENVGVLHFSAFYNPSTQTLNIEVIQATGLDLTSLALATIFNTAPSSTSADTDQNCALCNVKELLTTKAKVGVYVQLEIYPSGRILATTKSEYGTEYPMFHESISCQLPKNEYMYFTVKFTFNAHVSTKEDALPVGHLNFPLRNLCCNRTISNELKIMATPTTIEMPNRIGEMSVRFFFDSNNSILTIYLLSVSLSPQYEVKGKAFKREGEFKEYSISMHVFIDDKKRSIGHSTKKRTASNTIMFREATQCRLHENEVISLNIILTLRCHRIIGDLELGHCHVGVRAEGKAHVDNLFDLDPEEKFIICKNHPPAFDILLI